MTVSFDTLSFAKRLTQAGEKPDVAEAHAMALKEFVMETVATKADISVLREDIQDLRDEIGDVRGELKDVRGEIKDVRGEIKDVRAEIKDVRDEAQAFREEVRQEFATVREEIRREFSDFREEVGQGFASMRKEFGERFASKDDLMATKQELRAEIGLLRKDMEALGLNLTVRMGGMLVVAIGVVATLGKVL